MINVKLMTQKLMSWEAVTRLTNQLRTTAASLETWRKDRRAITNVRATQYYGNLVYAILGETV